jgi:hypothetical protein
MSRKTKSANTTASTPIADVPMFTRKTAFCFRVTEFEDTYLHVGDVVDIQGREHVVKSVNPSCARVVPITEGSPKKVSFKPKFAENPVEFIAPERNAALTISPNSELVIKRRLGAQWRERV